MTVELGRPHPLHAGSSSKAFLAFLPKDEQTQYLAEMTLDAVTSATITDRLQLEKELRRAYERGYATSIGERQAGASSVAAPLLNHKGYPIAVMSLCGPSERFNDFDRFAVLLVDAASEISGLLGFRGIEPAQPPVKENTVGPI
jgi:DNA-binding IclR family transcriptional regulator